MYGVRTTTHYCDPPSFNGKYYKCDASGNSTYSWDPDAKIDYGPDSNHEIDSTKPFHVKMDLDNTCGTSVWIRTTLIQGD